MAERHGALRPPTLGMGPQVHLLGLAPPRRVPGEPAQNPAAPSLATPLSTQSGSFCLLSPPASHLFSSLLWLGHCPVPRVTAVPPLQPPGFILHIPNHREPSNANPNLATPLHKALHGSLLPLG